MESKVKILNEDKNELREISKHFKLPIEFSNNTKNIFDNLYDDLELLKSNNTPFYKYLYNYTSKFGENIVEKKSKMYSTDRHFLKDYQKMIENTNIKSQPNFNEKIWNLWTKTKNSDQFIEKYQFFENKYTEWLNHSSLFLLIFSFYSIASPILNLLAPLLILIIPFIILKVMKVPLTIDSYTEILLKELDKHSFGQIFTRFSSVSVSQKAYIVICFGMYVYSIYQSVLTCFQFYKNTYFINNYFNELSSFVGQTNRDLNSFIKQISPLTSFNRYKNYLIEKAKDISILDNTLKNIPRVSINPIFFKNMGFVLKQFYLMNTSQNIHEILYFSFGFHGFIESIEGLREKIKNNEINKATFSKKKSKILKIKNNYYPIIKGKIIKNDIDFKKNIIITGPNAAGKTTILKSVILNVLCSQQTGYGFYDKIKLTPFDYIHCYLNIPDTSGRDSLFQAEARRCKTILEFIENNKTKRHFCIFDELYSGTNPYEAIASAGGYLEYISNNKNVSFMLTTHFIRLCELLDNRKMENMNMETIIENDKATYTYKMKNGISKIKGAITVLKYLDYPDKILVRTREILEKI